MGGPALALSQTRHAEVLRAARNDVSAPLMLLAAQPLAEGEGLEEEDRGPLRVPRALQAATARDPVLQDSAATGVTLQAGIAFDGIGLGFYGANARAFDVVAVPPDPQGDVGPDHYVQIVNASFAVFSKSGKPLFGPVPTRTLFSGFGAPCDGHDDGDGVVLYDPLADRWLVAQFALVTSPQRFHECVAVSTSGDPTGSWARYDYAYSDFNDYPKFGVWPDGYYVTYNSFTSPSGGTFQGITYCAMNRARMLAGDPAEQQCILIRDPISGATPADLDGTLPPPLGEP